MTSSQNSPQADSPLAIVLAAGKGTRMGSEDPKVLCKVLDRPMIEYVLDSLAAAGVQRVVAVVGYRAEQVQQQLADRKEVEFVLQEQQLGTGHAVKMAHAALAEHEGPVVIVAGDSPMLQADSLRELLTTFQQQKPACLLGTLIHDNPAGLGRIVRDGDGGFEAIVEHKDATAAQREIREVNMSTYVFNAASLRESLEKLSDDNKQGEFYLTDCPGILKAAGAKVIAAPALRPCEALSINTPEDLQRVEDAMKAM